MTVSKVLRSPSMSKEIKPTGEPRRVNFDGMETALWNTKGEDKKKASADERSV
jgi:hypothetical protein